MTASWEVTVSAHVNVEKWVALLRLIVGGLCRVRQRRCRLADCVGLRAENASAEFRGRRLELGLVATKVCERISTQRKEGPNIAIVHDYLNQRGGAERVVAVMHEMFPSAPIYTLFYDRANMWGELEGARILPTFLQKFGWIKNHFKLFFWLYPLVIMTIDLSHYDLVISSSSAYAKGVRTRLGSRKVSHICYCHTPMRFAWSFSSYIDKETSNPILRFLARVFVKPLKWWDVMRSRDVDLFLANSHAVQRRIRTAYARESLVVYPPVDPKCVIPAEPLDYEPFFLIVSRLVGYKRIDLAIEACKVGGHKLLVIGDGPARGRLEGLAGPDTTFLGWQADREVKIHMARCAALIFPGEEDFGITPLEVNACGRPVIAFAAGGALDTVVDGVNGVLFDTSDPKRLSSILSDFLSMSWDVSRILEHVQGFSKERFKAAVMDVVMKQAHSGG